MASRGRTRERRKPPNVYDTSSLATEEQLRLSQARKKGGGGRGRGMEGVSTVHQIGRIGETKCWKLSLFSCFPPFFRPSSKEYNYSEFSRWLHRVVREIYSGNLSFSSPYAMYNVNILMTTKGHRFFNQFVEGC